MKKTFSAALCLACSATAFLALPNTCEAQIFRRIFPGRSYDATASGTYEYNRGGLFGRGRIFARGTTRNYGTAVQPAAVMVAPTPSQPSTDPYTAQPNISQPTDPQTNNAQPNVSQSLYPPQGGIAAAGFAAPTDRRGRIVLNVPPRAEVSWNGSRGTALGNTRSYLTLPLTPEGTIQKFEARWTGPDGQPITLTREVRAMPNAVVTIDFLQPEAERAPAVK
jgi:hypothetical protein